MAFVCGYMGRIVKDPELKQTQSGKQICSFSLASEEGWGDKKHTDFIPCVAWNKTAQTIVNYLHKGDNVIFEGSWGNKPFAKNDKGYDIPNWQFNITKIHFMPKSKAAPTEEEDFVPYGTPEPTVPNPTPAATNAVPYSTGMADQFAVIDDSDDLPFEQGLAFP